MEKKLKEVNVFLGSIDELQYRYLELTMQFLSGLKRLIRNYELTKEDVVRIFGIKPSQYNKFIKGNYNYDTRNMAALNAAFMEYETERLKEKVPMQVAKPQK
jgi:predicted transcriptional regulator